MAKSMPEDHGLSPDQFPELNGQFFREERGPHDYIHHRLRGLLLAASNGEAVTRALDEGLTVGKLRLRGHLRPGSMTDEDMAQFAALEAVVLFHHAAETLVRLVLAMEGDPPCPWLELTRLRQPREFPKRTKALADHLRSQAGKTFAAKVLYGRTTRPDTIGEADWDDVVDGAAGLVRECAQRVASESSLYNSAKHGLSTIQGDVSAELLNGVGEATLTSPDLPSLTYLEGKHVSHQARRKWHMTTDWIEADRTVALVHLVANQVENLWKVARFRYVDPNPAAKPHLLSANLLQRALHDSIGKDGYRVEVTSVSISLLYEA